MLNALKSSSSKLDDSIQAGSTNVLHVVRLSGDELERYQASKASAGE